MKETQWVLEQHSLTGDWLRTDANFVEMGNPQPVYAYVTQLTRKDASRWEPPVKFEVEFANSSRTLLREHEDPIEVPTLRAGMDLIEMMYAQEKNR